MISLFTRDLLVNKIKITEVFVKNVNTINLYYLKTGQSYSSQKSLMNLIIQKITISEIKKNISIKYIYDFRLT